MNIKTKTIIMCCSIIGVLFLLTGTFAYFKNGDKYAINGKVVNWSFKVENKNNAETFTKSLGDIEPGSTGSFTISLDPTASTTKIECTITPNVSSSLAGMKLYSDSSYTTEITNDNPYKIILNANSAIQNVTIYWKWEYDTGLLTNNNVAFSINVVGKQIAS